VVGLAFSILLPQLEIDVVNFNVGGPCAGHVQNNSAVFSLDNAFLHHVAHIRHICAELHAVGVVVGNLSKQQPQGFQVLGEVRLASQGGYTKDLRHVLNQPGSQLHAVAAEAHLHTYRGKLAGDALSIRQKGTQVDEYVVLTENCSPLGAPLTCTSSFVLIWQNPRSTPDCGDMLYLHRRSRAVSMPPLNFKNTPTY
jgi:hypothetical protein